jgi:choice-of-anchor A domain-containing protein
MYIYFFSKFASATLIGVSLMAMMPRSASAASLGNADGYNVFLLGDMTQNNTDSEGKVAVGGNVNLSSFATGMNLSGNSDMLVVGGNVNYPSGTVGQGGNGGIVYGGNLNTTAQLDYGSDRQENLTGFFGQASQQLNQLSDRLFGLSTTNGATSQRNYSTLNLTGTNTAFNLFNVSAADFQGANSWQFNVPGSATVVVNISGGNVNWQNTGFALNGLNRNQILYNFAQTTALTLSGIGIQGSILAPDAAVNFNNGQVNGQLIAQGLSGTGQTNLDNFAGNLPDPIDDPAAVPTPALLPGLVAMGLRILRRQPLQ